MITARLSRTAGGGPGARPAPAAGTSRTGAAQRRWAGSATGSGSVAARRPLMRYTSALLAFVTSIGLLLGSCAPAGSTARPAAAPQAAAPAPPAAPAAAVAPASQQP